MKAVGWRRLKGIVGDKSPFHSSYERGCQAKILLHSSPLDPESVLASRPFLLRGEDFGFDAWSATASERDTDRSCWSSLRGFMPRSRPHSLRSCASLPLA